MGGMGMDDLEQVFPDVPVEPVEAPQDVVETAQEVTEQIEAAPIVEQQDAPVAPPQVEKQEAMVPLSAMQAALHGERERRIAAEEQARRFQEAQAQMQQAQQFQRPDPLDDPDGHEAYLANIMEQRLAQERFQMSDMMAKQAHGEETVQSAVQWATQRAQSDPMFAQSYMRQPHPIDWIVQQHKQQGVIEQIGNRSIDDFVKDYIAKNPGIVAPPPVQQQAAAPARVPRSLATQGSGPSDVREIATGPLAGVDAVFTN